MESPNLNSSDPLDRELQSLLAAAPLPDDGFSARVLAALPPRRKTFLGLARRDWLVALLAAGAVVWLSPHGAAGGWQGFIGALESTLTALGDALQNPGPLLALATIVGTLALVSDLGTAQQD